MIKDCDEKFLAWKRDIMNIKKNLTGAASGVAKGVVGAEGRPIQEEFLRHF